jgi:hypothetical protein
LNKVSVTRSMVLHVLELIMCDLGLDLSVGTQCFCRKLCIWSS